MKMNELVKSATRMVHKVGFKLKKHSPEILVVTGVTGVVVSSVMACKATTKAGDILAAHNREMDKIHRASALKTPEYTAEDVKKDTFIAYAQTAVKFIKLYGPSVTLGVTSITCILGGHNMLRKRNVALAAAYTAVDKGFKEYRGRVVERFGEELDKELRYGIKAKEFVETTTDSKGKEKTVTKTVNVADPNEYSDYARVFDNGSYGWSKDAESNLIFLKQQQNWANEVLQSKGHLFLNEVYDMLNIPRTKAGQVVGWIYDKEHPTGDNFVDFGIYNLNIEKARDFVNGYERSIVLDFNVDGPILDLI